MTYQKQVVQELICGWARKMGFDLELDDEDGAAVANFTVAPERSWGCRIQYSTYAWCDTYERVQKDVEQSLEDSYEKFWRSAIKVESDPRVPVGEIRIKRPKGLSSALLTGKPDPGFSKGVVGAGIESVRANELKGLWSGSAKEKHDVADCNECGLQWVVGAKAQSCPRCCGRKQYDELAQCYQVALAKLNEARYSRVVCAKCGLRWDPNSGPKFCAICDNRETFDEVLALREIVSRCEREAKAASGVAKLDSPRKPRSVWCDSQ